MYTPKSRYVAVVVCLLVLSGGMLAYSRMMERIPKGEWGGPHISMNVEEQSAKIEYDCAHGEIFGPLSVNDEGKFQLRGTFTQERGGPIRADETSREQKATYTGTVKGNTLMLTLKLGDSDDAENFTLEKDKQGKLVKCK